MEINFARFHLERQQPRVSLFLVFIKEIIGRVVNEFV